MFNKKVFFAVLITAVAVWVIARWIPASGGLQGSYTFKA